MNRLDFNCYCGNWPFFRIRYNTISKLSQLHSRCGIAGGFVSSCEAIFYQDPYEAELQLAQELKGTAYMHAMVLNPMLPGWQDDLRSAVKDLNIKAVRLMPGFHNYSMLDPVLDDVCHLLLQYQLPLILTLRIRDERTNWMFHPKSVPVDDVAAFLDCHKTVPTLLACARKSEILKLQMQFAGRNNLFTDISGFKDSNFAVNEVLDGIGGEHIVYGSSAPLLELQSTTITLERANLPESVRNDIFSGVHLLSLIKG